MSSTKPSHSETLYARATELMPAGVNSPVRAFRHVGGAPLYITRGEGAFITDEDGQRYIDFCMAWGPLILGHGHPSVLEAVQRTVRDGLAFGTCHRHEIALAELVLEAFSPAERVRFVVSGTEAVLTAVRLARGATKRRLLLKFSGCYHGHVDTLMVKAGSGVATFGLAESEGVTATAAGETLVLPLGDLEALETVFQRHGADLAAVILEPLPANNGLLIQTPEFLQRLRTLTQAHGTLLIFDEVISGFRFGFHGYSKRCGVQPDLQTLGKIVGGGLPVGAIVGRKELLDQLAPLGKVYQAGTMAGNPVALAAGIATLQELKQGAPYTQLETLGRHLEASRARLATAGIQLVREGSIFWPYLGPSPVPTRAEDLHDSAVSKFRGLYRQWLARGIYLPPSAYEVGFLTAAHTTEHVDRLVDALAANPV